MSTYKTMSMGELMNILIAWNIGFECTHRNAAAIREQVETNLKETFGESVFVLLEACVEIACAEENNGVLMSKIVLVADQLAVDKGRRPDGWVASGIIPEY